MAIDDGRALQYHLNRLAGTLNANDVPTLGTMAAANRYASTTSTLETVGALNYKAGTSGLALQGVLNKLAGTSGLGVQAAASRIVA